MTDQDAFQTRPHVRTPVTITDLDSSKGTFVDGEKLERERVLDKPEHTIVLAKAVNTLQWVATYLTLRIFYD